MNSKIDVDAARLDRLVGRAFALLSAGKSVFEVVGVNDFCAVIQWPVYSIEHDHLIETVRLRRLREMVRLACPVRFNCRTGEYDLC